MTRVARYERYSNTRDGFLLLRPIVPLLNNRLDGPGLIDINARVGLGVPPCTAIALRAAAIGPGKGL